MITEDYENDREQWQIVMDRNHEDVSCDDD